jgi:hypothetical protein
VPPSGLGASFGTIAEGRRRLGQAVVTVATIVLLAALLIQFLYKSGHVSHGFETWQPLIYFYVSCGVSRSASRRC